MSYDPNQPQQPDSGQQPQPPYEQPGQPQPPPYGQPPYGQPGQPQPPPYGQPPYGQPGQPQPPPYGQPPNEQQWGQQPPTYYGQPGQPQQPPYGQQWGQQYGAQPAPAYMPPQQPRQSRRALWIVLGIIGGLIVLSCALCGIFFVAGIGFFAKTVAGPVIAVNQYYDAVKKQDYSTAFSYISANSTVLNGQTVTQDLYTTAAQAVDTAKGKVTNYSVGVPSVTNNTASVTVTVTRASATAYDVQLQLQQVNGSWKITSINNF
jgi:hypothetical protein